MFCKAVIMDAILLWIKENQILSGAGGVFLAAVMAWIGTKKAVGSSPKKVHEDSRDKDQKATLRILFIDDEHFKVVEILRKAGWLNVKRVRDVASLDDPEVVASHIFFVDIQGVGSALKFKDEGLGLAEAI